MNVARAGFVGSPGGTSAREGLELSALKSASLGAPVLIARSRDLNLFGYGGEQTLGMNQMQPLNTSLYQLIIRKVFPS